MNHSRQISAVLTVVLMALLMLWLCLAHLNWNPDQPWPPLSQPYIELSQAEEFVEPEPLPLPKNAPDELDAPALTPANADKAAQAAPESGAALRDKGPVAQPPREVTAKKPSTVKKQAEPKPDKAGAASENAKQQAREAQSRRTNNAVKNAFAKPDSKNNANNRNGDSGNAGRTDGNPASAGPADSKSKSAGVSHGRVGGGWQWPAYAVNISTAKTGSVVLSLTIDRNGNVTKAVPTGGEAPAASDSAIIQKCIAIAKSRRFTRAAGSEAPETAVATLTFTFR